MTQDAPLDQKALEAAIAWAQEGTRDDTFSALTFDEHGALIERAIGIFLDALSRRVPAGGGELKGIAWSDLDYLMSIIDSAIEDGFDPDEDGPLLDQIRAELKAPTAASPIVAAPEGWWPEPSHE